MSGTPESGRKARDKNLANDPDFYKKIGKKGGAAEHSLPGGFGSAKVGADGLTGRQRAGKVGGNKKRGEHVATREENLTDGTDT